MPPTHTAVVIIDRGQPLERKIIETPEPTSGQVLVRVLSVCVGPTHKAAITGELPFPLHFPLTPGAGCIGRVEAVGSDATTVAAGQLVFVDPTIRARDDPSQRIVQGLIQGMTEKSALLGRNGWRDGTWTEKAVVPLENTFPLDEKYFVGERHYSFARLTWVHRFCVPLGGLQAARLKPGETVVVAYATGSYGNAAVELALAMGARRVIGLGRTQAKLDTWKNNLGTAKASRVEVVVVGGDIAKDTEAIKAATPHGAGAEVFLDMSPWGASETASVLLKSGIGALKIGGRLVIMGGVDTDVAFPYMQVLLNNIQVIGNFMNERASSETVIRFLESGLIDLDSYGEMVYEGLEKIDEALDDAAKNSGGKHAIVLNP